MRTLIPLGALAILPPPGDLGHVGHLLVLLRQRLPRRRLPRVPAPLGTGKPRIDSGFAMPSETICVQHIRGHPFITFAKFSGFWTPSPPVRIFTQPPLLRTLLGTLPLPLGASVLYGWSLTEMLYP